jgi:hypothetical protein
MPFIIVTIDLTNLCTIPSFAIHPTVFEQELERLDLDEKKLDLY